MILLDEFNNSSTDRQLCRKIKQVTVLAIAPVVMLSTASDIELIANECEAKNYVRKPFDKVSLYIGSGRSDVGCSLRSSPKPVVFQDLGKVKVVAGIVPKYQE